EDVEPLRRAAQRVAAQRRPDRVRLQLWAGHQLATARRSVEGVLDRRVRGADDHRLAAEVAGRHLALQHLQVRDYGDRARAAVVVDPGGAKWLDLLARRALRDLDGEARQAAEAIEIAALGPVRIVCNAGEPGARTQLSSSARNVWVR